MTTQLETINANPRDERIRFVEDSHTYYIDGSCKGYISSTTLVHTLFDKFDADKIITKMRNSRNWVRSPYKHMTDEQIKKKWKDSGDFAAKAGTKMHLQIENYYNDVDHDKDSPEFRMFEEFVKDHPELEAYRPEWVVFDEESKVSGSIDMVYSRKNSKGEVEYVIADWKRSKEIKMGNRYQSGIDEFTHQLEDCNYNHYSLQLSLYKYILEKNYGIKIAESFIVVLHPNQKEYIKIRTENLDRNVKNIMRKRAGKKPKASKKRSSVSMGHVESLFNMGSLKFDK